MNTEQEENSFEETTSNVEAELLRDFIEALPLPAPPQIARELERMGYRGQDAQRRAVSLMAYRHVRRLKRIYVDGEPRRSVPPKQNILMTGPTGCGKTFLVELLFQQMFQLPTVIIDITSFTESGYIGDDARTVLTRLIEAAGGNTALASVGVVCLDEFDKIASASSNARFAGQGTTKDVSGYGVQRELLTMLDGADVMVPMDYGFSSYGERAQISTRDIPFIACGAFSGLEELIKSRASIGFRSAAGEVDDELTLEEVGSFHKYGFLPELIGRFARIVNFPALPPETLRRILVENVLPQFEGEFKFENLGLRVTNGALDHMIARSEKRGTGARGLHAELVASVEQAAYDNFGERADAEVVIDVRDGKLQADTQARS